MYFLLYLILIYTYAVNANDTEIKPFETLNLTVYNISDSLVNLFDLDHENAKIKELKEKLNRINTYVVDNNLVADVLTNVTIETKLNETNFYQALNENDHFRYLSANDSKNLYLKLKERMTRDDILNIVAERSGRRKWVKSARRMMQHEPPKEDHEELMNDVVDKMLGHVPEDQHKHKYNESQYWDPQAELEEQKAHHESKLSGRRIYNGERTTILFYPFMASIHVMGRFWCGAVLYWHDLLLTSASCLQLMHNNRFFRENPRVVQVRIGSNHSRIGGEVIDVLEVYFHPGYNSRSLSNNLAAVRIRRHLHFTHRPKIKLLTISVHGHSIPPTAEVLVLGWGVTKMSQKLAYEPIFLQRKFLPVYPNKFCKEVYGDKFVSENMFCAGTLTTGEGACDHDAGGPAILAGRLVGIISFGPAICGFANAPTVFTLVGAFSDWIETVNESMPNYYRGGARTTTTTKSPLSAFLATYKLDEMHVSKPTLLRPMDDGEELLTTPSIETTPSPPADTTTVAAVTDTSPASPPPPPALREGKEGYESDGGWSIDLK